MAGKRRHRVRYRENSRKFRVEAPNGAPFEHPRTNGSSSPPAAASASPKRHGKEEHLPPHLERVRGPLPRSQQLPSLGKRVRKAFAREARLHRETLVDGRRPSELHPGRRSGKGRQDLLLLLPSTSHLLVLPAGPHGPAVFFYSYCLNETRTFRFRFFFSVSTTEGPFWPS